MLFNTKKRLFLRILSEFPTYYLNKGSAGLCTWIFSELNDDECNYFAGILREFFPNPKHYGYQWELGQQGLTLRMEFLKDVYQKIFGNE